MPSCSCLNKTGLVIAEGWSYHDCMHTKSVLRWTVLAALSGFVAGCTPSAGPATPAAVAPPIHSVAWPGFLNTYVEASFTAQPLFAAQSGRHEFDGKMPDWSRSGIAAEVARLNTARAAAAAFDATTLSKSQRFERDYLVAVINQELYWLTKAEQPFRNPAWYVGQLDPEVYLSRQYAPLEKRIDGYIGYALAIPAIAENIRNNLRTPLPKAFVDYSVRAFGGFADFYATDVPKVFASIKDAAKQQQLKLANDAASRAMAQLRDWFIAQRKTANDGFALGPALYATMLRDTESVDLTIDQIEAAGKADLARNVAALRDACGRYAPGKSVTACVQKMEAHKSVGGVIAGARAQLDTLRAFVVAKNIVTVPGTEQALVQESPPYNRANSAYISTPGAFDKGVAYVYNVSPPDPSWTQSEQLAYTRSEALLNYTSVHEVWPGHFLQFLYSNSNPSVVSKLWVGYGFAEGWAHYSEQLMWDEGLNAGDDEQHVGQLREALERNGRLLSSIGMHTQGMTLAQSIALFHEQCYQDIGTARQQAARGTYDPAYLNYTLGKLMITKLRDEWLAKQQAATPGSDPKSLLRAFHDQFLSYGGPPIPLVRHAMVGEGGALL
jgi:uncharacterized protein (DUF885 family)